MTKFPHNLTENRDFGIFGFFVISKVLSATVIITG